MTPDNLSKPRVLYVDDEHDNLISFKYQFQDYYYIFLAHSAKEGYQVMKKENIQIIISDQRMPDTSGTQFFEQISDEFPQAVRIILTGYSDFDAVVSAINDAKVYYYLQKPWQEEEIKFVIKNALESIDLSRENQYLVHSLQENNKHLKESEQKYRNLFLNINEAFCLNEIINDENGKSVDCRIRDVNPAFEVIVGKSADHIIGKTMRELFPYVKDMLEKGLLHHAQLDTDKPGISVEQYFKKCDKWLQINSFSPAKGKLAVTLTNISERKEAERILKENHQKLEELIKERTKALEETNQQLLKRTRELETFNKVMIDRESRIVEVKEEVNALCKEMGREIKYPPVWYESERSKWSENK